MDELEDFPDWMQKNKDEIEQAQAFTKGLFPDNPVMLAEHLSRAQSEYSRMGYLLADAECHVIIARARETIASKVNFPNFSGPERKSLVENKIRDVVRVRDILQTIVSSLKQKCFGAMNLRKVHNAEHYE